MDDWIFGLSIDDKIEWKLARLIGRGALSYFDSGPQSSKYGALEEHPGELNRSGKLKSSLREALSSFLQKQGPEVCSSIRAIGISSVGTIDRYNLQIITVGMSDWLPHQEPILDLPRLFGGLLSEKLLKPEQGRPLINLRNETTAKCLAEWHELPIEHQKRKDGFSILYVLFSEGVNASFVSAGRPIVMPLNTEMGHMYPRPHVADFQFNENHRGCDRHIHCFESLASLTRIRKSWGTATPFEQMGPEAHDRIAYYAAQMCLNGIVMFAPSRVLLGGPTFFPAMVPLIKRKIERLNIGKYKTRYVTYADMDEKDFIRLAVISADEAGIAGALALAHQVEVNPGGATSPTGSPWWQAEITGSIGSK